MPNIYCNIWKGGSNEDDNRYAGGYESAQAVDLAMLLLGGRLLSKENEMSIAYSHHIIAHGKALAECLSEGRPLSDSKYRTTLIGYSHRKLI